MSLSDRSNLRSHRSGRCIQAPDAEKQAFPDMECVPGLHNRPACTYFVIDIPDSRIQKSSPLQLSNFQKMHMKRKTQDTNLCNP